MWKAVEHSKVHTLENSKTAKRKTEFVPVTVWLDREGGGAGALAGFSLEQ